MKRSDGDDEGARSCPEEMVAGSKKQTQLI